LILLLIAAICYVPLLMHIRGNLKEYCCHKVDKRIGDIMKRKQKERRLEALKLAQKEARGDFSHLKNKKGELIAKPLPQPTLPNLSLDDDDDTSSMATRGPPPSAFTQEYHYPPEKGMDYPPMPAYNPYSSHPAPGAPAYYPSFGYDDQHSCSSPRPYDDENKSATTLVSSSLPFARDPVGSRQGSPYYAPSMQCSNYDPVDVYQGRAASTPASSVRHLQQRRISPPTEHARVPSSGSGGLAYDG